MGDGKKFKFKGVVDLDGVAAIFEELVDGLKEGMINLSAEGQTVTYFPGEEVDVSIKAKEDYNEDKDRDEARIKIQFRWKKPRAVIGGPLEGEGRLKGEPSEVPGEVDAAGGGGSEKAEAPAAATVPAMRTPAVKKAATKRPAKSKPQPKKRPAAKKKAAKKAARKLAKKPAKTAVKKAAKKVAKKPAKTAVKKTAAAQKAVSTL